MPFEINTDMSRQVLRTTATGPIRFEDLQTYQATFENKVLQENLVSELVNLADADFRGLRTREVAEIARQNLSFLQTIGAKTARFAVYGPEDLQFGLSRVFEAWTTGDNDVADVRVFRDLDKAERWLLDLEVEANEL